MIADLERENEALAAQEQLIMDVVKARQAAAASKPPVTTLPPITVSGGGGGGKPTRDKAAEAAAREAEAVRRLIADLEHELSVIGMSNVDREVANALRRANVDAASAEGRQIAALVTAIEAETDALERAKEAKEQLAAAGEAAFGMIGDALTSVADGSVKAEDAVKKLAVQLALAAAQAALLGTGPLAGLFGGGLFGGVIPGRERGGPVSAGQPYIVGEKRPEIFVPNTSGRILPHVPAVNGAGGGGTINAPVHINIDATGADAAQLSRVQAQLAALKRDLPATVIDTVRKAQKSNVRF